MNIRSLLWIQALSVYDEYQNNETFCYTENESVASSEIIYSLILTYNKKGYPILSSVYFWFSPSSCQKKTIRIWNDLLISKA